ncbi:hypothetical protein SCH01S_28_01050 [Sphingomonas changbaiensis NBRC 104936]|uniref:Uncharacterized protein n=1 Tax=Sphingomonas changbaiensis NBRC 104936 TaxID=1219043 RepID=A0A0E9MNW6_9SPHN|nr:hypothetical protein SCH01S_28_01050 [Sphingomonas changbaiensis NBRC 104936]
MTSTETLNRQRELEERRLGMRSLDPTEIARHFGRAAELRALIARERLRLVSSATGTKGSSPRTPF